MFLLFILPLGVMAQKSECGQLVNNEGKYCVDGHLFSGVCLSHYDNGIVRSRSIYLNGLPNGEWTWWWDNGRKQTEITLTIRNGYSYINGVVNNWYSNGRLRQKESYKNGLPHGDWYKYDLQGAIIKHGVYRYGEHISGDNISALVPASNLKYVKF
jgi:antitoxin component YwqK of YwqJK toxin-antitoxin module